MSTHSPARLSIEGGAAFLLATAVTIACVVNGWFDHLCMTLRRSERYELDEFVGAGAVFMTVTAIMLARREWQLRGQLKFVAEQEQTAREAARHDYLTGIPNRLALVERLDDMAGEETALLLIDLDGFKSINDRHGHAGGDEVLKEVSRRLMKIRASERGGFVARLGGDEFGFLLHVQSARDAQAAMRRIARDLARPIHLPEGSVTVGASIGSATATAGRINADTLLRIADTAMYDAKHARQAPRRVGTA
ncbi:GGDEF domain-containing protein [Sphingomonas jatrophae]|uniref:Diguanylate cyclase (GGDEF) domain-containing protein n=1 Tax=Sphingomonas jatrophae TaxID=1166337 RepID=A0A1I6JZE4_9SPHN|nr:GGDEF domain-containing protein [Sphingomonas jatrophae]SFR84337.1 diguanylate cyclase (GGDEF) domain-containing protein [Sphingomonas jatrophae]